MTTSPDGNPPTGLPDEDPETGLGNPITPTQQPDVPDHAPDRADPDIDERST
jgi:hypothetical protein